MQLDFIFLPLHIGVLLFIVWNIFLADKIAFAWFKGKIQTVDAVKIKKFHNNIFNGLIGMVITGLVLFWPLRDVLLVSPAFRIKMLFVVVLFINSFFVGKFMSVSSEKKYSELSLKEKLPLVIIGTVSTIAWISAILTANFLDD